MTDAPTSIAVDQTESDTTRDAPRVRILLTVVEDSDLEAALAVVRRQVYEPSPEVIVVGGEVDLPDEVGRVESLVEGIAETGSEVDYLWILHSDARPRPDALGALVTEVERAEASLGGSKVLVAGSSDVLESIGSATDVFGEPYSGLDEGEIDLQQYDVVREVAFVDSTSMLVRRDLAQGLRGLDVLLPPEAAGLDFSQRTRLAGGKVIIVPSSEVYHQGRCEQQFGGWRERAGRLRAMATAYRPLTLAWVIPYDFLVSVLDALANLLLLRWRPLARHVLSFIWNTLHLPSLIVARHRFKKVRALGDEELFRFQARGSVRLRSVGEELTGRVLVVFDEDQALARGTRRLWGSPGIWGAVVAALVVLFAARSIIFIGVPNIGSSFPLEAPSVALDRFLAGWNEAGLGSASAVHPVVGLTGFVSLVWFGAEGAARTLMTIGFGILAVAGMGRLGGRVGFRGPGRYLSGLVLLSGPGVAILVGNGSWAALGAAALLPWAVRAVMSHSDEGPVAFPTRLGWALLLGVALAAFSPAMIVIPLVVVLGWKVWRGRGSSLTLALMMLLGATVAIPFLLTEPGWLLDVDRRASLGLEVLWPALIVVGFIPLLLGDARARRFGGLGAVLALGGLIAVRAPLGGPGAVEAALILASFGAAMVVTAGLDALTRKPAHLLASLTAAAILVVSVGTLANGRLGLPAGDYNDRLSFATALADEGGPGRILIASVDRAEIPGEARPGPGYWYRLLDGGGTTLDEVWLPGAMSGDDALAETLERISTGGALRPGSELAEFAIDWVVLVGPSFRLDEVLIAQLDLVPTPLDPDSRVFENPEAIPMAATGTGQIWDRQGAGFSGNAVDGRLSLAVNYDSGWSPGPERVDWHMTVDAAEGSAVFRDQGVGLWLALGSGVLVLAALAFIGWGRARR